MPCFIRAFLKKLWSWPYDPLVEMLIGYSAYDHSVRVTAPVSLVLLLETVEQLI